MCSLDSLLFLVTTKRDEKGPRKEMGGRQRKREKNSGAEREKWIEREKEGGRSSVIT